MGYATLAEAACAGMPEELGEERKQRRGRVTHAVTTGHDQHGHGA